MLFRSLALSIHQDPVGQPAETDPLDSSYLNTAPVSGGGRIYTVGHRYVIRRSQRRALCSLTRTNSESSPRRTMTDSISQTRAERSADVGGELERGRPLAERVGSRTDGRGCSIERYRDSRGKDYAPSCRGLARMSKKALALVLVVAVVLVYAMRR